MDEQTPANSASSGRKNNTLLVAIGVIVLLLIGGGLTYFATQKTTTQSPTPAPTSMQMDMHGSPTAMPSGMEMSPTSGPSGSVQSDTTSNAVNVTMSEQNFSITPATLTVKKGDKVTITVKNTGGTHDFVLDGYNLQSKTLRTGESDTLSFVATKTGKFPYFCSIGNHRQMGMEGTMTVQ